MPQLKEVVIRYILSPWPRDVAQDFDRYLPRFYRNWRTAGVLIDRGQESTYRFP